MEEVLKEMVFIKDLQVLECSTLKVIIHAIELRKLAVATAAFPVRDLSLIGMGAVL